MNTLLHVGLSNAILATLLAFVAFGVSLVCRRPALVHSLWLLVLLKLLTPPLVSLPILQAEPEPAPPPVVVETVPPPAEPEIMLVRVVANPDDAVPPDQAEQEPTPAPATAPLIVNVPPPATEPTASLDTAAAPAAPPDWTTILVLVWLSGSAGWLMLAGLRVLSFRRLLRHARPATESLRCQVQSAAERVGLAHCPSVWLLPGRLSPMVWSLGCAPRLLLPSGLWERLTGEQQATLLTHELAHLRRRDHWVRGLELLVTCLYWWHPAVWWARRELRQAEEECCDAWVVSALPRAARAYATALVETLDFLSEPRSALPLGASGMGHISNLKRRLTMIMQGTTPRTLTWRGLLAVLGLGAVLLPIVPTWVQAQTEEIQQDQVRKLQQARDELAKQEHAQALAQLAQARAQAEAAKAELMRAEANLKEAAANLQQAQARVAQLEGKGQPRIENMDFLYEFIDMRKEKAAGRRMLLLVQTPDGQWEIRDITELSNTRPAELKPPRTIEIQFDKIPIQLKPAHAPRPGEEKGEPRAEELKKQLDHLMREVEELRQQLERSKPEKPQPKPTREESHDPQPRGFEGIVKHVDDKNGLVAISIGSDDGLARGHVLRVIRLDQNRPQYMGTIRIVQVGPTEAVGTVDNVSGPLQIGDKVGGPAR